ncbi:MAG: transposase [Thermodesulfobacteriota bacterium]
MPRGPRLDAPGTLHHVMVRGIERRRIFENDWDKENFLHRLGKVVQEGQASCFAWVLIPNHVHILMRTGSTPLARMMRRLLTGYAVSFNLRHQRSGHLFQNRYRSIVCEEDAYLLELVRYIHLNAVRARLVKDMEGLDRYRWSGHSVLMGRESRPWQAREEVLSYFGRRERVAQRRYRQFVFEGIALGRRGELSTGRGSRSDRGKAGAEGTERGDSRILGRGSFVEEVLAGAERLTRQRVRFKRKRVDVEGLLDFIGKELGVTREEILGGGRRREISMARSVFCYACLRRLGLTGRQLSEALQVSPGGVHFASVRGEVFVRQNGDFEKSLTDYLNN